MMSFEEFTESVKNNLVPYLSPEYSGAKVEVTRKRKVNVEVTGLSVFKECIKNRVVPSITLDHFYENYQRDGSMDDVLAVLADTVEQAYQNIDEMDFLDNPINKLDKSKVFMQLINSESNRDLLATVPHREFHDMSVIYRVLFQLDSDGMQSVVVTNDLAQTMEVSEEELFELAAEQTKELFPPRIQSMAEVMRGLLGGAGITENVEDELGFEDEVGMYMISNDYGIDCATNMVYDDVLYEASGRLGEDVYVLPSSIHEILLVPSSMGSPDELSEMVTSINRDMVKEDDRLSNQIFFYDRERRELHQASEVPILGIKDADFKMVPESHYNRKKNLRFY